MKFQTVSTTAVGPIPEELENFMKRWAKVNCCTSQTEAMIENYNRCVAENNAPKEPKVLPMEVAALLLPKYKSVFESDSDDSDGGSEYEPEDLAIIQHDNMKVMVEMQFGSDDIKWFCVPQSCKTQDGKLTCVNTGGWEPISLDEVTLVLDGNYNLVDFLLMEIAGEQGVSFNEKSSFKMIFTKRNRYPYLITGGLLFCRQWLSANVVAQSKFTLSDKVGNTEMTITDTDQTITINRFVAMYLNVEDHGVKIGEESSDVNINNSVHLFDETGKEYIIMFNHEHNKHPDNHERFLPCSNAIVNFYLAKLLVDLLLEQMICEDRKQVNFTSIKLGSEKKNLILIPKYLGYKDGKVFAGENEMFEIDVSPEELAVMDFKLVVTSS
ncbi:Hypothetical protein HVR_LOCUS29 [uncultured virus]|nr:Hypothetical protein HVR_LOCUS29 [uncultured virus]